MTKKRVLLVDDHPLLRSGMAKLINDQPDFTVCGEVSEARKTIDAIQAHHPDLVVLDLSMQGEDGLEVLKNIKVHAPKLQVLILSMHDESIYAPRALRAGAAGYVSKQDGADTLIDALRKVASGNIYFSEKMAATLLRQAVGKNPASAGSPVEALSDRELEVFTLIGKGYSTRETAEKMGVSIKTVESHRAHIKEKLHIDTAPALIRHAVEWVQQEGLSGPNEKE